MGTPKLLSLVIVLLCYSKAVWSRCSESDQIECGSSDRCTRIQYICDGDNDCGDYTDENSELCAAWRNSDCSRGSVLCRRYGENNCVSMKSYCEMTNPPCEGDLDMRLCTMLHNEKIAELSDLRPPGFGLGNRTGPHGISNLEASLSEGEDFSEMVTHTLKHDKCPSMYTRVGDECISFFFFGNTSWGEARVFCQSIGGDLFVPETDQHFNTLVQHLKENHLTSDFWVGGTFNDTLGWKWVNDKPIELGTTQWTIRHNPSCRSRSIHLTHRNATLEANDGMCYYYSQAPAAIPNGDCVAMTYDKLFFLSDEDCLERKSPLCKLSADAQNAL